MHAFPLLGLEFLGFWMNIVDVLDTHVWVTSV